MLPFFLSNIPSRLPFCNCRKVRLSLPLHQYYNCEDLARERILVGGGSIKVEIRVYFSQSIHVLTTMVQLTSQILRVADPHENII